jgi:hypothetical protein
MALLHVPHPMPFSWVPYLTGAVLALITLRREIADMFSRALAVITTLTMFFFFAAFFMVVPRLSQGWYAQDAVCLLLGAFAAIPILSNYSCRLKANNINLTEGSNMCYNAVPKYIESDIPQSEQKYRGWFYKYPERNYYRWSEFSSPSKETPPHIGALVSIEHSPTKTGANRV